MLNEELESQIIFLYKQVFNNLMIKKRLVLRKSKPPFG